MSATFGNEVFLMIRITSGWAKGLALNDSRQVRPTRNIVRQALFDILRPRIARLLFIDLFAGTGAIGIEALANGASSCLFVEDNKQINTVLRQNIASLRKSADRQQLVLGTINHRRESVARFLNHYRNDCQTLVWADPPYQMSRFWHNKLLRELQVGVGSTIVFESSASIELITTNNCWLLQANKRYGDTMLTIWNYMGKSQLCKQKPFS